MTGKRPQAPGVPPVVTAIGGHAKILTLTLIRGECQLLDLRDGDVIDSLRLTLRGGGHKDAALPRLVCTFGVVVEPVAKGRDTSPVAKISCEYGLQYDIDDPALFAKTSEHDAELFAAYNASVNAWPHAREFVQSMAARMVLPPVVLPLFRPSELIPSPEKWQKTSG
jgi:hypothetical protein